MNRTINMIALTLVIVGALNWGLIGFFGFNLVNFLLGGWPLIERLVYILVGICGLYSFMFYMYLNHEI
ncbi:MAG: DUF378 domain-containing protein [Erysipelotrichales bacterium]|nr:DUF378 domain-containing protein [Erysipelotrichales bacterium]